MNDRYLFRGKRVDNGEWVYSESISIDEEASYICVRDGAVWDWVEVQSESICQCTGARDVKDQLIYEGDIIINEDGDIIGKIVWSLERHRYIFYVWDADNATFRTYNFGGNMRNFVIIHNIHDNPDFF